MQIATGCCNKKGCNSADASGVQIEVKGLKTYDTLIIYSYVRNSGFRQLQDSFFMRVYPSSYPQTLPRQITHNNDLRLFLGTPSIVYEISDFVLEKAPCNYCFNTIPKDYYRFLKSYVLNGKRVENRTVIIQR